FWVLVLFALFYPHKDMHWFLLGLAATLVAIFLLHLIAGRLVPAPLREAPTHPVPTDPEWDRDLNHLPKPASSANPHLRNHPVCLPTRG
ncbi:MAG: hypothetical protein WBW49_10165, partial [Candidatus Acidiferrum sp.]